MCYQVDVISLEDNQMPLSKNIGGSLKSLIHHVRQ